VAPVAADRRGLSAIPARFAGVWPGKGGGTVYGSPALGFAGWTGARRLRRAALAATAGASHGSSLSGEGQARPE
jgi:hypothetical protein